MCPGDRGRWCRCWFSLNRFFLECLLVLFKASVASWPSCTLSSCCHWEGEKQDEDSFFPCLRTATWVSLLFVCNRLQKTGHHSGSQMLRNGAKCEEESQVGVSPMVVIFSLWWGHFPLWESCLLKGYGPNLHWFLGSGKSPIIPASRIRLLQGIRRVKIPVFLSCLYLSIWKISLRGLVLWGENGYKHIYMCEYMYKHTLQNQSLFL